MWCPWRTEKNDGVPGCPNCIPETDLHFVSVAVVVVIVDFMCFLWVFFVYLTQTKHNEKQEP